MAEIMNILFITAWVVILLHKLTVYFSQILSAEEGAQQILQISYLFGWISEGTLPNWIS